MPDSRDAAFDALLRAARAEFSQGLPAKRAELEELLAQGAWAEVRRAAHKLRGSAGVYGFDALAAAAARLEDRLLEASPPPADGVHSAIEGAARDLVDELARACLEAQ